MVADTSKSKLMWLAEKVTGQHTGTVRLNSGWLTWENNEITAGEFLIDMSSIKDDKSTGKLMNHLKSDDFFGVKRYPFSRLTINGSSPFDRGSGIVRGTLTIKESSNPVEFKAAMKRSEGEGLWFYTNMTIDRTKYNIRYGSGTFFDNLGDKTIFDEFKLRLNLLVK
jgi:polyisoprenoid-binding protein YceI